MVITEIYDIDKIVEFVNQPSRSKEEIISYVQVSHIMVRNYLNAKEEWMAQDGVALYQTEVAQLTSFLLMDKDRGNISQKTQGERSITYSSTDKIPPHIKMILPPPYARSLDV